MKILSISGSAGSGKDTVAARLATHLPVACVALADPLKRFIQSSFPLIPFETLWGPSHLRTEPVKAYEQACTTCKGTGSRGRDADDPLQYDRECRKCTGSGRYCPTVRDLLQTLGTQWGRAHYDRVWVEKMQHTARALFSDGNLAYDCEVGVYNVSRPPRSPSGRLLTGESDVDLVIVTDTRFLNELDGVNELGGEGWRIKDVSETAKAKGQEAWRSHVSETEQQGIPDDRFTTIIENAKDGLEKLYAQVDEGVRLLSLLER